MLYNMHAVISTAVIQHLLYAVIQQHTTLLYSILIYHDISNVLKEWNISWSRCKIRCSKTMFYRLFFAAVVKQVNSWIHSPLAKRMVSHCNSWERGSTICSKARQGGEGENFLFQAWAQSLAPYICWNCCCWSCWAKCSWCWKVSDMCHIFGKD